MIERPFDVGVDSVVIEQGSFLIVGLNEFGRLVGGQHTQGVGYKTEHSGHQLVCSCLVLGLLEDELVASMNPVVIANKQAEWV